MKKVISLMVIVTSFSVNAKISFCHTPLRGGNANWSVCGADLIPNQPLNSYSTTETDQFFAEANGRIANLDNSNQELSKRVGFLENRVKKTEAALEQEIVIPESAKEEMKKEIIEELKKEYNLIPKN
jgi:hypothetical protein